MKPHKISPLNVAVNGPKSRSAEPMEPEIIALGQVNGGNVPKRGEKLAHREKSGEATADQVNGNQIAHDKQTMVKP